jgi:prepilin-type N-terminal cleavage/methylation domain-containing protein/prepilin-type processing-associated H-X9-DG protein
MKRAFTLIELLVVIAIIAILAAILFPVFAQAKTAAQKTSDLSNIKQLLTSTFIYAADYDDEPVMLRNSPSLWMPNPVTRPQVNSAHNALEPYVKNRQIWRAPNDNINRCDNNGPGGSTEAQTGGAISYVFSYNGRTNFIAGGAGNRYGFGISGWAPANANGTITLTNRTRSVSANAIGQPANTVWMLPMYISWSYWNGLMQHRNDQREYAFEELGWPNYTRTATFSGTIWCAPGVDMVSMGNFSGQTNFGFADGHAKTMRRDQLMDRTWLTDPAAAEANFAKNLIHVDERYK